MSDFKVFLKGMALDVAIQTLTHLKDKNVRKRKVRIRRKK